MMRWSRFAFVLAALLLTAVPASAAKLLVLESSTDTGLQKGDTVDGNQKLAVKPDNYVVLMDESGEVVTVRGPYNGIPGGEERADGPSLLTRMAAIVTTEGSSGSTALGLTRGLNVPAKTPTVWSINIAASGTKCIKPATELELWRPAPTRTVSISITHKGTKEHSSFEWPGDQIVMPWPKRVNAADGASYVVTLAPPEMTRELTLRIMPATVATDAEELNWMATVGCTVQAKALIDELSNRRVVDGATASGGKLFK
jgi:hypothetical protein